MAANDSNTAVERLKQRMRQFVRERDWQQFHDPKNLAMSIAIEAAELMEHFQWVRSEEAHQLLQDEQQKQQIAEELADVVCFVLSFANVCGIDITQAVLAKIEANERKYPADRYRGRYK